MVFEGTAMDLGIGLWANFELINNEMVDDKHVATIRIPEGRRLNDLVGSLIQHVQLVSVNEVIPDMDQIFIEAVKNYNASHE